MKNRNVIVVSEKSCESLSEAYVHDLDRIYKETGVAFVVSDGKMKELVVE